MDVKVCLVFLLLSVITSEIVQAAVSDTTCTSGNDDCKDINYAECDGDASSPVCECKTGYKENNNDECQPELDSVCTSSDKCADANAACTDTDTNGDDGTCKCSSGFKDNPCVAKVLNDACSADVECKNVDNAACTDGKCSCADGYNPDNSGGCQQVYGMACSDTEQCPGLSNSICTEETCQCADSFVEKNKVCVPESGAASTKAMIWMMFSVLLIRLVDKLLM